MKRNKHKDHVASCLCCKHLWVWDEESGYSEYTPGSPAGIECNKKEFKPLDFTWLTSELKKLHDRGKTCKSFEGKDD